MTRSVVFRDETAQRKSQRLSRQSVSLASRVWAVRQYSRSAHAPPKIVRQILAEARRRYWSMPLTFRPGNLDHILTQDERLALIHADAWPLGRRARAFILQPPAERAQQIRRERKRIERVMEPYLARELPDAVDVLVGGRR